MGDPQSTAGVLYQIKSQTAQSTANIAKLQEAASHVSHLEQLPQGDQDPHIIVLRALVKQGSTLIGDLKHIQTELDQLLQEAERIETPAALLPTINKRIGQQNSLLEQLVELVENISELQKEIKEASTRKKRFPVDFLVTACYIVILVLLLLSSSLLIVAYTSGTYYQSESEACRHPPDWLQHANLTEAQSSYSFYLKECPDRLLIFSSAIILPCTCVGFIAIGVVSFWKEKCRILLKYILPAFVMLSTVACIVLTFLFLGKALNNPYYLCSEKQKGRFLWAREFIFNLTYSESENINCAEENENLYHLALVQAIWSILGTCCAGYIVMYLVLYRDILIERYCSGEENRGKKRSKNSS